MVANSRSRAMRAFSTIPARCPNLRGTRAEDMVQDVRSGIYFFIFLKRQATARCSKIKHAQLKLSGAFRVWGTELGTPR